MAQLWTGAPAAAALTDSLIPRVQALRQRGIVPTLAILRVGERSDDLAYENAAIKRCEKVGIAVRQMILPSACAGEEVLAAIRQINGDPAIHGCLMLRPLPDREVEEKACALLDPRKDVDAMTPASLSAVFSGKGDGYPPCTAQACMEILDYYGVNVSGKRAVVVGRSLVVGRPLAMLLLRRNATVTLCHTRTQDPASLCREAEILIAAAGKAGLVTREWVSPGQVVLDVGVNVLPDGRLSGDVAFQEVEGTVEAITPVPGGVGAVTTAVLCKHVVHSAEGFTQ